MNLLGVSTINMRLLPNWHIWETPAVGVSAGLVRKAGWLFADYISYSAKAYQGNFFQGQLRPPGPLFFATLLSSFKTIVFPNFLFLSTLTLISAFAPKWKFGLKGKKVDWNQTLELSITRV